MKEVRKCKYCGKEFVPRSGSQKYCCEECQTKAKEARKKRQQDFMNAVEPVIDLQCQEYLTFAKAAILMGCSRQYIYKLVNEGKLAASRISSRMTFVRKADIEKMLAGNPYHRVLPTSRPKKANETATKSAKAKNGMTLCRSENVQQENEGRLNSFLCLSSPYPHKREYGQTFYSKSHFEELRRTDLVNDDSYYTARDAAEKYGMSTANVGIIAKI